MSKEELIDKVKEYIEMLNDDELSKLTIDDYVSYMTKTYNIRIIEAMIALKDYDIDKYIKLRSNSGV